jgi:hypothetical protein
MSTVPPKTEHAAQQNAHGADPGALVLQIAMGMIPAACLNVAARLKIADHLADRSRPVAELAHLTQVNENALYRVLRALASLGIFTETAPHAFANTPASETLREGHHSLRDMAMWMSNGIHFRVFGELMHAVKTGDHVIDKLTGMQPFEYLQHHKEDGDLFNAAMTSYSKTVVAAVVEAYAFSGMGTLADIAGGHGALLTGILEKNPGVRGVLFDQEHVVSGAAPQIAARGLGARCRTAGGDFFAAVPAADNYVLKHIIHDWDDARAEKILKNCAAAMTGNGKVLLIEAVVPAGNDPHYAKVLDLEMLAFPGGRERTEAEFAELLARAGLRLQRVVPTQSPMCIVEAVKA